MQKKGGVKFINRDQRLFYQTLKQNVQNYFTENNISVHGNATMIWKSVILLTLYIGSFITLIVVQPHFAIAILLWIMMGISLAGVGMSVMHDANHGAYSANPRVNYIMGHTLNLAGGAVFNWKLQHNILHHTYTNIAGLDDDIDNKGGMRFTRHDELKKKHQWQFIYAFALYGLITLYWVIAKDFVQYVGYRKNGVNAASKGEYKWELLQIIFLKVVYFFTFLVLPTVIMGLPFWQVIVGFLIMHFVGGIILSVVFQLAHTVEGTTHPVPDENDIIGNSWAVHQLETTMNFAPNSKLLSWYVGGLNFQVEHHLFPKICHVHYPKIAPIVQKTAQEFNIPYLVNPTLSGAIQSHINHLRTLGRLPSLNDIID
jgi:linoleoyl-CoA desaturase